MWEERLREKARGKRENCEREKNRSEKEIAFGESRTPIRSPDEMYSK